jgi:hypothetical protein
MFLVVPQIGKAKDLASPLPTLLITRKELRNCNPQVRHSYLATTVTDLYETMASISSRIALNCWAVTAGRILWKPNKKQSQFWNIVHDHHMEPL